MSEKIFACLLRLFPSAFRRHYEEEALRLLRDRLRDERGFFRRLRLSLDLMVDLVGALPQAYRNSYAEVAPASPLTPHFEGRPLFRALQNEPIRPLTFAIAGALSLTALLIFAFMMGRSTPYHAAAGNGQMSPIQSVIERLNQPISSDSAGSGGSDAPQPTSANAGRREISRLGARPLSETDAGTNVEPSSGTRSAASAASRPPQLGEQTPNASYPDHGLSRGVAVSSPLEQSQPETIRNTTQSVNPANMQASIPATVAVNLSGKWAGSIQAVGGDADVPQWFILKQDSAKLSGSGGPVSPEQYPITDGLVAGDSVRFELSSRGRTFVYDLRFEGNGLRGILSIKSANEMRVIKVRLERVQ